MAKKIKTIFQNLDKALNDGWVNDVTQMKDVLNANPDEVVYKADTAEEYQTKKLELQQNSYLKDRWIRANSDLSVKAFNGLNNIKLMYRDVELMDSFPEIGAALDLVAEEACTVSQQGGHVVNVYSKSDRIKNILEDLFVNRLNLNVMAVSLIRGMCKYGNQYMLLNLDNNLGVCGWREIPPFGVERLENGITNPYGGYSYVNQLAKNMDLSTKFTWMDESSSSIQAFRNWQIAHFRLLTDTLYLPYGVSFLNKARRHFRMLSLMEDMMLIYRLDRSVERRVFKIFVGAIDDADVEAYMESIVNQFKRKQIVDPVTGQIDLRKNILPVHKSTPIPLLDGRTISIEELAKEFNEGKTNYVYSVQDNTHQIVPGKVVWCGKNYTADRIVKVTLDDDSYMLLAPEHEVVMRDGSRKRADELISGESVMPFYRKNKVMEGAKVNDYETVYNPHSGKYEFTHRLVGLDLPKEKGQTVIHHKNIRNRLNRFDNTPENLQWMGWKEHIQLHHNLNSAHQREVAVKSMKEMWSDTEKAERNKLKMVTSFDDFVWDSITKQIIDGNVYNRITLLDYINDNLIDYLITINNSKKLRNNRKVSRAIVEKEITKLGYPTITEFLDDIAEKNNAKLPSEIVRDKQRENVYKRNFNHYYKTLNEEEQTNIKNKIVVGQKEGSCRKKGKSVNLDKVVLDDYIWETLRLNIINKNITSIPTLMSFVNDNLIDYILEHTCNTRILNQGRITNSFMYRKIKEKYNMSVGEYIQAMKKNHKVSKIEYIDGDDVYCMTVKGLNDEDDRHNFALRTFKQNGDVNESGCFVSNCSMDDIFIPIRDQNSQSSIETLQAAQNLTAIDDIKYMQNKVLSALRIPRSFLNFDETQGDGKNLALMDIRFTRVVNRIQQAFLLELTKVATIHLYLLGFEDELTNFTLSMNNPSTQSEQLEVENMQKKILAVRDAVSDPGTGIPIMSLTRALRSIMKWSDKDIQDNFEELRLEKGLAAELEKTSQIIKKTGIFDTVDRIYGEPGAEYQDDNAMQGGDDNGLGGGGGGGSLGGGLGSSGLDDVMDNGEGGDEDVLNGNPETTPLGDENAEQSNASPTDNQNENPNESVRSNGKLLVESVDSLKNFEKVGNEYDKIIDKLIKHEPKGNIFERCEIYDKSMFINKEMDEIVNNLEEFAKSKE